MGVKLGKPVRVIRDWVDGGFELAAGEVVLLENCRFNKGEKKNVEATARKYAALCDLFVMDAFGTRTAPRPRPTAWRSSPRPPVPVCWSRKNSKH